MIDATAVEGAVGAVCAVGTFAGFLRSQYRKGRDKELEDARKAGRLEEIAAQNARIATENARIATQNARDLEEAKAEIEALKRRRDDDRPT